MACEDYPCCGHEPGCCPDFDESGKQLNMKCTCGKTLPINSRYSICDDCMNSPGDGEGYWDGFDDDRDHDYDDDDPIEGIDDSCFDEDAFFDDHGDNENAYF